MERPASPDPIDDPKGYQDHLLGLLGDDDPAAVQARTPATLRQPVRTSSFARNRRSGRRSNAWRTSRMPRS